ncbi:MAG TPA: 5-formyltetrahydrofolate cyclo-ligase [Xanthomonadaceae bacterium]|nr:5-formyltetrahydrofolate cyclo-ligase [Xanthomonadaceae bacterium]
MLTHAVATMTEPRELRRELRERRARIPLADRFAAAQAVAEHLLRMPVVSSARRIAGYWAVGGEMPLHGVVTGLSKDSAYCLPVLHTANTLRFVPWRVGDAIGTNRFGIPEPTEAGVGFAPSEVDVVLLPLLGFTRNGDRVGTGGGWYDRSFVFRKRSAAPPLLIGVGFACQQIDDGWTPQPWDVPLDAVATEREFLVCPLRV